MDYSNPIERCYCSLTPSFNIQAMTGITNYTGTKFKRDRPANCWHLSCQEENICCWPTACMFRNALSGKKSPPEEAKVKECHYPDCRCTPQSWMPGNWCMQMFNKPIHPDDCECEQCKPHPMYKHYGHGHKE